jgi:hypothetical protein
MPIIIKSSLRNLSDLEDVVCTGEEKLYRADSSPNPSITRQVASTGQKGPRQRSGRRDVVNKASDWFRFQEKNVRPGLKSKQVKVRKELRQKRSATSSQSPPYGVLVFGRHDRRI